MNESVLFIHGFDASSDTFVLNKNNSPAFYFANQGIDVWLIN